MISCTFCGVVQLPFSNISRDWRSCAAKSASVDPIGGAFAFTGLGGFGCASSSYRSNSLSIMEVRRGCGPLFVKGFLDYNPKMAALTNWFVGDENGNIKYVSVVPAKPEEIDPRQPHITLVPTSRNLKDGKPGAGVQRLDVRNSEERSLVGLMSHILLESANDPFCSSVLPVGTARRQSTTLNLPKTNL